MVLRFGLALAVFALIFGLRMVRELRGAKLADWAPAAACLAVVGATLVEGCDGNSEGSRRKCWCKDRSALTLP